MKTTKTSKPKFLNVAYVANKPRVSLFQDLVFQLGYCVIPAGYLHISQLHVCSFVCFWCKYLIDQLLIKSHVYVALSHWTEKLNQTAIMLIY